MVERNKLYFLLGTAYDISSMESVGSSKSFSLVGKVYLSKCFYLSIFALSSSTSTNPYFPLRRAYLLLFSIYFYAKSQSHYLYSFLFFSFGKHHVVSKDLGTYVQLNMGSMSYYCWHHPCGEYVGRQKNKPLSFYVCSWNVFLMCTRWVLAIIEDYMMVEYVELLLKLHWISWIAISWWLRT